jgi:hypothetical protein
VATLELGLLLTLLIALLALVTPLAYLFYENLQLGRAAGDVVRFTTSRSEVDRRVAGAEPVEDGLLPNLSQTRAETARAYTGVGTATLDELRSFPDSGSGCPSGRRRTVVLSTTVDIGPFAGLLISGSTKTLTATATSCEE